MIRTSHLFGLNREVAEVSVVVCAPAEWEAHPDASDPRWSVWHGDRVVIATALVLPGSVLRPPSEATGRERDAVDVERDVPGVAD